MNDAHGGTFAAPRPLEGLSGPAADLPWLGLPLGIRQERAFLRAGLRFPETPDPAVGRALVREDVALFPGAIEALVKRGRADGRDLIWRAGGRTGAFVEELSFGQDEPLLVWLAPGGSADDVLARIGSATVVEFDPMERPLQVPVPHPDADMVELPVTERMVMPAGHWLQLLWANLLGLAPFLWRELAGKNVVELAWKAGGASLRARSLDPRKIGARLGRKGRGCRIHPSAVVEASWLGDGVEIGAGAVVRASVLATGSLVEDLALVEGCVLGSGAKVQRMGMLKYSVLGDRAAAAGDIQLGVLDQGASVKKTATLMDMAMGQEVQVLVGDVLHPAPLGLAGVCVGRDTVVGAGVRIAPGRVLPPGIQVACDPAGVLRRIPAGISGPVAVRDGTLHPLGEWRG